MGVPERLSAPKALFPNLVNGPQAMKRGSKRKRRRNDLPHPVGTSFLTSFPVSPIFRLDPPHQPRSQHPYSAPIAHPDLALRLFRGHDTQEAIISWSTATLAHFHLMPLSSPTSLTLAATEQPSHQPLLHHGIAPCLSSFTGHSLTSPARSPSTAHRTDTTPDRASTKTPHQARLIDCLTTSRRVSDPPLLVVTRQNMYHSPSAQASPSYLPIPPSTPRYTTASPIPSSAYVPRTPVMDSAMYTGASSSPSSPFISHDPNNGSSSYQPVTASSLPTRSPYMQAAFPQQTDGLAHSSPMMLAAPAPRSGEQHVTVHELSPIEGAQGTPVVIKCDVKLPSTSSSVSQSPDRKPQSQGRALRIVFGSHPVQTQVMVIGSAGFDGGQICQLNANVPSWSSTSAQAMGRTSRIPVYVQVLDGTHAIVETVLAGEFTYNTLNAKGTYSPYAGSSPVKRAGEFLESHRGSPSQFLHRRAVSHSKYDPPMEGSPHPGLQPGFSPVPDHLASPFTDGTPTLPSHPSLDSYSASPIQPNLMRATQIQPPGAAPVANPYPISGSTKARLELQGDLDAMAKGWTQEEWMNRRRLVQFWRRQEGTAIFAAFRPLSQQDYPQAQQSIIISCIFREDRNECYVTSVDAIYLLEALVGTRFTVEEKNRIRRNLEGFRPLTVSKSKQGSEDFFKLIMGFPNPKPRNIEKDVKVFPWEILGPALKKIIGKYSASYPHSGGGLPLQTSMTSQSGQHPYPAPAMPGPHPIQESFTNSSVISSGSVPALVSQSSSDSSNFSDSFHAVPETPIGSVPMGDSPHHRSHSSSMMSSSEKMHAQTGYVNFPGTESPYSNQPGHGYWSNDAGSTEYSLPGGVVCESPHLPHIHETQSRQPSSNDLRVVYQG